MKGRTILAGVAALAVASAASADLKSVKTEMESMQNMVVRAGTRAMVVETLAEMGFSCMAKNGMVACTHRKAPGSAFVHGFDGRGRLRSIMTTVSDAGTCRRVYGNLETLYGEVGELPPDREAYWTPSKAKVKYVFANSKKGGCVYGVHR